MTTKVQGDMVDISGNTAGTVAAADSFQFFDATDSLAKTDTVQGVLDLVPASGGAWNLIGTAEASADASLTITGLDSTYDTYAIAISDMVPATNDSKLWLRMGDSGGIDSGATDYSWANHGTRMSTLVTGSNTNDFMAQDNQDAQIVMGIDTSVAGTADVGSTAGEGIGAMLYLHRPGDGTTNPMLSGTGNYWDTGTPILYMMNVAGGRRSAITLDRIQVLFSAGNIASGRLTIWGLAHA